MKTRLLTTVLIVFGMVYSSQGQNTQNPRMKVTSVGINFGFAGAGTANTNEDFQNLRNAVEDPELFLNPSDYNTSKYNYGFGGNASTKVYLGLTPYSKKKGEYRYDRELRFSLGSGIGIRQTFNYYNYDTFTIDTLQSASSGNTIYADSVIYDRNIYSLTFNEFNIGVSYLFKTPFERRFQFQAGAGIEYALAYRSYVNIENLNEQTVAYYEPNNPPVYSETDYMWGYYYDDFEGTTTEQNTNLTGSMHFLRTSIPLGINFRIARKEKSFFSKVYLWGEMNPGIEVQIVPDDKTYVNPYFGMAWLGITYRW